MTRKVLVPVDGSELSGAAFDWAINEFPDAQFTLLHVVHPSDTSRNEGETVDITKVLMSEAKEILDGYKRKASEVGAERKVTVGRKEAEAIVRYVNDSGVDTVVIGSHGRTGLSRVVLGSVAEGVVRRAPVPVVVVR